jgi:vancomycin resistance protein YoaR
MEKLGWRRRRRRYPVILSGALLLAAALTLPLILGSEPSSASGQISYGVEVGGMNLGGKSPGEAERLLGERARALNEIRVSGNGGEAVIPVESLGVEPDIEATVEGAMQVGRKGSVFKRLGERSMMLLSTVEVPVKASYDEEALRVQVEGLARRLDTEPLHAEVWVAAGNVDVSPAREGYTVDVNETADSIRAAIEALEVEAKLVGETKQPEVTTPEAESAAETARTAIEEPATIITSTSRNSRESQREHWRLTTRELANALELNSEDGELRVSLNRESLRSGLSDMYASVETQPEEAGFRFSSNDVEVIPSKTGKRVESQKLLDKLQSDLPKGKRRYEALVVARSPEFTTQEAREQKPARIIGEYRTTFMGTGNNDPSRVDNLRIASNALTGETLAPGEMFSANDVLATLDYQKTGVFVNGSKEKAVGGGLCQVASTLYMAANYAGMKIAERHPHQALLNYIRPGLDATVWFGAENGYTGNELDMRFKNTSDGYIMIREYVADDGYIYAEVWGQPTGKQVTMDSVDQGTNRQSSTWTTYKAVKNAAGETLSRGPLYNSTYYALQTDHGRLPPTEVQIASVRP